SSFSSTHGPPTSSPFPYTTLFRSEHGAKDLLLGDGRIGKDVDKHRRFDEVTLRVQLALRRSAPRDEASLSFADLNVPEDLFPLALVDPRPKISLIVSRRPDREGPHPPGPHLRQGYY